jgi:hypothetical protein
VKNKEEYMCVMRKYEEAKQALYDHVGFKEDWVVYPINDSTDMYWKIIKDEVLYAESEVVVVEETGEHYVDVIDKQRYYKKWVYEGEELTMIFCNPHIDGMRWFRIFDNEKRIYD